MQFLLIVVIVSFGAINIHFKNKNMKKITLLLLSFVATASFGQSTLVGYAENTSSQNVMLDPCSQDYSGGPFELAVAVTDHGPYVVANDIVVEPQTSLEIQSANLLLLPLAGAVTDISAATLIVYEDSGVGPGAQVATSNLTETGNALHPETFAGFQMWNIDYELDTPISLDNPGATAANYWFAVSVTSASAQHVYWVGYIWDSTGTSQYNYQSIDGGSTYAPVTNVDYPGEFFESEWIMNGECTDLLSVESNLLSKVSVYPNPTSEILNLKVPSNVEVTQVTVFDLLGKDTGVSYNNGVVNTSGLSQGVYLLKVETSAGTLTQKIVKQ